MSLPCVSRQALPHDVVDTTGWLRIRLGVGKGADAMTVNRVLDIAGKAEIIRGYGHKGGNKNTRFPTACCSI